MSRSRGRFARSKAGQGGKSQASNPRPLPALLPPPKGFTLIGGNLNNKYNNAHLALVTIAELSPSFSAMMDIWTFLIFIFISLSHNNPLVSNAPSLQIINIIVVVVVYLAILTFSHFNSE